MYEKFKGIFPALLTPYNNDDEINYAALSALIEMLLSQDVNGFYVSGSTAEAFLLSHEERRALIEKTAAIIDGRAALIAQVGCISTKHSVDLAKTAQCCGYDAISSVAPFYYKFKFEEIKQYYFDLADAVDIPVIIYYIPAFSGVSLSVEQMSCFLQDDRFAGVKYTSSDYFTMRQLKTAFPEKVILNGFDETFLAGLSMGADGAIGSTYNFMADRFIRILKLFRSGDVDGASKEQKAADEIIAKLCSMGVMQGEKAVLTKMGIPMGTPRAPFIDITDEQKAELYRAVF